MSEWSIGVNANDELYVMHGEKAIVGFTADYTYELYMALHAHFNEKIHKNIN